MKSRTWFGRLGRGASFDEKVQAAREMHGDQASKWLADKLGVSVRTAQRYLAGTQRPSSRTQARMSAVDRGVGRRLAAEKLRTVSRVNPGRIIVYSRSPEHPETDGKRRPGWLTMPSSLMNRVADLYAEGRDQEAEELFDNAVMARYGNEPAEETEGLASILGISSYDRGIDYR